MTLRIDHSAVPLPKKIVLKPSPRLKLKTLRRRPWVAGYVHKYLWIRHLCKELGTLRV